MPRANPAEISAQAVALVREGKEQKQTAIELGLHLVGSMGKVASAYDNALTESFFGSMKIELLGRRTRATRTASANAISEWTDAFYNPDPPAFRADYLSSIEFEGLHTAAPAAA